MQSGWHWQGYRVSGTAGVSMHQKINANQLTLPGVEMAWCKCGCGQSFMRVARGRRKEYINKSHKKREARRLAKERQGSSTARLAPMGYLYLHASENHEISALWAAMGTSERAVIAALCQTGLSPTDLMRALSDLFNQGVF